MSNFRASKKAGDVAFLRQAIRKAKITRAERDITIRIINLWYYHKDGPEKLIRPGRKLLARQCKCSVRTVASCLKKLREAKVLKTIAYQRGGNKATRYQVMEANLLRFCGYRDDIEHDIHALNYYLTKNPKIIPFLRPKS